MNKLLPPAAAAPTGRTEALALSGSADVEHIPEEPGVHEVAR